MLRRDRGLLKHRAVTRAYWLRETDSRRQISEILQRFDLVGAVEPFARCVRCNDVLQPVSKDQACRSLPPRIAELNDEFSRCPECGRIYWKGSHHARMLRWIAELTSVH